MAEFIRQEMFNMFAVSAAKISAASNKSIREATALIMNNYQGAYLDANLAKDVETAANGVTEFMLGILPPETLTGNLTQMQFCIKNFNPDGTRKRKRIFGGTFFNKEKSEIRNKVQSCKANIATYHMLVIGGSIPIAPQGWSL
ncbi:MAG: hypothetical protein PHH11_17805 [Methylomonas sp.]|nr:hypothetical protein [Methylomonas sp.]